MGTTASAAGTLLASAACVALIQEFEGCAKRRKDGRYDAYPDPGTGGDPWTIGWGSTGPGIKRGTIWTQAEADERLERDVMTFALKVAALLKGVVTAQEQFDAMVSLAYNVGAENLRTSTLLKLHRAGDHAGAVAQFSRWNKAAGKVLPGLTRRRAAEARLYQGLPR
jgi:GH24 family phage-related lysozyme (muramidase)